MESFWLTAFTNIWRPYYASKSVNCPLPPAWTEHSATSPSPWISALSCICVESLHPLCWGLGTRSWGTLPGGFSTFALWTQIHNTAVTKFFRSFPNTYHIPLPPPEIKGPTQVAPTVSGLLNSCSRSQGAFTARGNFLPLQQNLPALWWWVLFTLGAFYILLPPLSLPVRERFGIEQFFNTEMKKPTTLSAQESIALKQSGRLVVRWI